jgi:hypothetical protein
MKTKIYFLLMMACITLLLPSCLKDDPLDDFSGVKPVIELPYASSHSSTTTSSNGKDVTFKLMVNYTIADWREQNDEIVVGLGVDKSLVGNNTLLPASAYTLPANMTIAKQTQFTSIDLNVSVAGLAAGKYTLPVVITSVPTGYTISGNFNYVLFILTVR